MLQSAASTLSELPTKKFKEVMALLRVSRSTLNRLLNAYSHLMKDLCKVGREWRFSDRDIALFFRHYEGGVKIKVA
jgi:hypothetical protein